MDYEMIKHFTENFDPLMLIIILIIGYFYFNPKLKRLEEDIKDLKKTTNDMDKRLFAIETILHMKDCCLLKDDRQQKKAE